MGAVEAEFRPRAGATPRGLVGIASGVATAVAAWAILVAMVAGVPAEGRAALGPLMGLFGAADLPPAVAASFAVLCLAVPTAPTDIAALAGIGGMWLAMTVAMMLPPTLPGLLARGRGVPAYALGQFAVWGAAALAGAAAQMGLVALQAMTPLMTPAGSVFAATVLVAAGFYQFTPAKLQCLERCRRPRPADAAGPGPRSVRAGAGAALDGLGCCLGLMAAMFAVGLMNLVWLAILTALYSIERASDGAAVPRAVGAGLILWGATLLAASPVGPALLGRVLGG